MTFRLSVHLYACLRHFTCGLSCSFSVICLNFFSTFACQACSSFPLLYMHVLQSSSIFKICKLYFLLHQVRTGYFEGKNRIDSLIADIGSWGATAVTIHGRSRQQRYSKLADWDYIYQCGRKAPSALQVLGNGDIFSYLDWNNHISDCPELSTCMIARGALIKVLYLDFNRLNLLDIYMKTFHYFSYF